MDPSGQVYLQPTIHDALQLAKQIGDKAGGLRAFVTGDGRLVGPSLDILNGWSM